MVPEAEGLLHGHQETKIGNIPTEWEVAALEDLSDPDASIRYGVVQIGDDTIGGVPIVPIKHIRRIGHVPLHRAAEEIERKYKNSRVIGGDILLSVKGTIGEVGIVPTGFEGNIAREIARIRLNGKCAVGYLAQQLDAPHTRRRIAKLTVGSTRLEFSIHAVKSFQVPLPPLAEQRKIADILSTWDRAIEKTESLLANAQTQKRALMQSLLTGKRRFPAFEGQPWKEVRLGEMGQTVSGGTPASETTEYWDGDVHWATPTDITKLSSRFIYQTARMITEDGLKKSSAKLVPEGTILICTRATIGEMAIATAPICTNQGFKNLVLSADFNSDFVFYLLQFFKKELIRYACGSTFLELSKKDFDKRSFMVPSLEEQEQIASVLNDTEDQIDEHRKSITKLRTEKKALMQQLLTGKRRVHV